MFANYVTLAGMMRRGIDIMLAGIVVAFGLTATSAGADDTPWGERLRHDLPRDGVNGVRLFVEDAWAIVPRPSRFNRSGWLKLAGVTAVGGFLYAFDEDIDRAVQRNSGNDVMEVVVDTGDALDTVALMGKTNRYYATGIAVGYVFGWEKLQRVSADILFSHFLAGMVRNGGKLFVGRARPREDLGAYEFGGDGSSLPSGHASTVFQLATILSKHIGYRPASAVVYTLALAVAIERVETREHFASDVWIGAWNGRTIAQIIMKEHDEKGILVVPMVVPETSSVGMMVEFAF